MGNDTNTTFYINEFNNKIKFYKAEHIIIPRNNAYKGTCIPTTFNSKNNVDRLFFEFLIIK